MKASYDFSGAKRGAVQPAEGKARIPCVWMTMC